MKCNHDLSERETACADGYCPICQQARIKELEEGIKSVKAERDWDAKEEIASLKGIITSLNERIAQWEEDYIKQDEEISELKMQIQYEQKRNRNNVGQADGEIARLETQIDILKENLAVALVTKKELEESLTIKILENAKGAQVLVNMEAIVNDLEAWKNRAVNLFPDLEDING
jgi:chromosome segregation ATPase